MPRARFYNLDTTQRALLVGVAMKEFARHGFADASLNRILAAARISKGAYYYYFEDKEDLFATTVEHALDQVLARAPLPDFGRLSRDTFWPAMAAAVQEWHTLFEPSRDLLRAVRSLDATRLRSPAFAALLGKARTFWRSIIRAGQRVGCVRTDLPESLLIRLVEASDHALDGALADRKRRLTRRAFAAHLEIVFDTFKRLLIAEVEEP